MSLWNTEHAGAQRRPGSAPAGFPDYAALAVVGAAPAILLLWLVPFALVLPALSIASFAIACAVALFAHRAGIERRAAGVNAWDVAAVFTGIWVLAGMMSGAGRFAALFDRLVGHLTVNPL
jgi:hypothetical protein